MHTRILIAEARRVPCRLSGVDAVEGNELHHGGNGVHGDDGDLPRRIESETAPMRATDVRGHRQRSLEARRREHALVAQWSNLLQACVAVGDRWAPDIIERECLRAQCRKHRIERLSWRRPFAEYVTRWNRTLFHGEDWLPRLALEHEELA